MFGEGMGALKTEELLPPPDNDFSRDIQRKCWLDYFSLTSMSIFLVLPSEAIANNSSNPFAFVSSDPRPQNVPPPVLVPPIRSNLSGPST